MAVHGLAPRGLWDGLLRFARKDGVEFAKTGWVRKDAQRLCEECNDVAVHGLSTARFVGWIASLRSQRRSGVCKDALLSLRGL